MADYASRLLGYFGTSCVTTCLAIAKELGIVDFLVEQTKPSSSQEVADKLKLKERYTRELLGTLAVGSVISVDETSSTKLFYVPDENKPVLRNVSVYCRAVPYIGSRKDALKKCYKKDGPNGVSYADTPELFDILEEILVVVKENIIDTDILPSIPGLEAKLDSGIKVAEFGCATGLLLNKLAARFPNSSFMGSDVAMEPLDVARTKASEGGLKNVRYEIHDLETLPDSYLDHFDWIITRDVIHDLPYPGKALLEIFKITKPGGFFSCIDIGLPSKIGDNIGDPFSMFYFTASTTLCVPESYIQRADSEAFGATWGRDVCRKMLKEAGFAVENETVSKTDTKEIHFVCAKPK